MILKKKKRAKTGSWEAEKENKSLEEFEEDD